MKRFFFILTGILLLLIGLFLFRAIGLSDLDLRALIAIIFLVIGLYYLITGIKNTEVSNLISYSIFFYYISILVTIIGVPIVGPGWESLGVVFLSAMIFGAAFVSSILGLFIKRISPSASILTTTILSIVVVLIYYVVVNF